MENVVYAGVIGPGQIAIVVVVILLLFGGKKIPEMMRGMGKGIKGFKDEMNGTGEETKDNTEK